MIMSSRASITAFAVACAVAFGLPRSAAAHNTTGVCWEDFSKNDFALRWDAYTQGGGGAFMGWSHVLTNGQLVECNVGGNYYTNVAASCWSWRHLCGNAYINVGADYHIHVGDFLGRVGPAVNRAPVQAHSAGLKLHIYMEQPGRGPGAPPELVDLDYIQIKTANAILSVKDASGVWWDSPVYTPNSADYYYDVSAFGWEITEAVITGPPGALTAPQLGGIYIATPSAG